MKQLRRLFLPIFILAGTFSQIHCDTNLSNGTQLPSSFVPSFLMWPTVGDISVATFKYGYNAVQSFVQNPKVAWSITGTALVGAGLFSWWTQKQHDKKNNDIKMAHIGSHVNAGKLLTIQNQQIKILSIENDFLKSENKMFKVATIDIVNKFPINENLLKRFEHPVRNWRMNRD